MSDHDRTRALRLLLLATLVSLVPSPTGLRAQALPFHTSTGITAGFNENAARHFVRFLGRGGLVRDGESVSDPLERDVGGLALVNGAILGAFTPLWTFRVIVPWVRKEMTFSPPATGRATFETSGVGDALAQTKWIFLRADRPGATTRLGLQGRLRIPLGSTDAHLPSGETAPRPLQVGTGSWGLEPKLLFTNVERRWAVHANLGGRFNTPDEGFEAGDALLYALALGLRLLPGAYRSMGDQTVNAYLELNGEVVGRSRVGGAEDPDSGGHLLHLGPGLQWVPTPWLLFEASVQLPVVQALNGTQLGYDPRLQVGTRYRFSLLR